MRVDLCAAAGVGDGGPVVVVAGELGEVLAVFGGVAVEGEGVSFRFGRGSVDILGGGLLLLAWALGGTRLGVQRDILVDDLAVDVAADPVEVAAAVGPLGGRVLGALPLLVGGAEVALELGSHGDGWIAQGEIAGGDGWVLSWVRYSWLAVKECQAGESV